MFGLIEMIFILHDERTVRFKQRYEQELMNSYSGAPGAGGGMRGSYAGPSGSPGGYGGSPGGFKEESGPGGNPIVDYEDLPENFPVNGISEEGIFDD
jgi:hypothetical protein